MLSPIQLIRLDGLWRRLARTICQEGGVQASRGEWCWNGTNASHHFGGSYRNGAAAIQRRNSESGESKDKYAHIRFGISELARELATKNGLSIKEQNDQQQQQKNANETGIVPSMREGIPTDYEDSLEVLILGELWQLFLTTGKCRRSGTKQL